MNQLALDMDVKRQDDSASMESVPPAVTPEPGLECLASTIPANNTLLQLFWDLASLDTKVRQKTCCLLIVELETRQRQHIQAGMVTADVADALGFDLEKTLSQGRLCVGSSLVDDASAESWSRAFHSDVWYCLKRLIRGLSSPRDGARQGFSLALTELLRVIFLESVPMKVIMVEILQQTVRSPGMKAIEERDLVFGRVFGYVALIQSRMVFSEKSAPLSVVQELISNLVLHAKQKPYFREWALQVVASIFDSDDSVDRNRVLPAAEHCLQELATMDPCPEWLQVISVFAKRSPQVSCQGLMSLLEFPQESALLHSKNFSVLSTLLRETTHAHPRVHSAWHAILDLIVSSTLPDISVFTNFWFHCVELSLFTASVPAKKYLGFNIFELALAICSSHQIAPSAIFTPNFLRVLFFNAAPNSPLQKAAKKSLHALIQFAKQDRSAALQFLGCIGEKSFDLKIMSRAQSALDEIMAAGFSRDSDGGDELKKYINWIFAEFVNPISSQSSEYEKTDNDDRMNRTIGHQKWCVDQLVSLARNDKITKTEEWTGKVLRFLAFQAFYSVDAKSNHAATLIPEIQYAVVDMDGKVREWCRRRFWTFLSELCMRSWETCSESDKRPRKRCASILFKCADVLTEFELYSSFKEAQKENQKKSKKTDFLTKLGLALPASVAECMERLRKSFSPLPEDPKTTSFLVIMILTYIQVFTAKNSAEMIESVEIAEDLLKCQAKMRTPDANADHEPSPVSVLVDILVSWLAKSSGEEGSSNSSVGSMRLLRFAITECFRHYCVDLDMEGLETLCKVLDPVLAAQGHDDDKDDQANFSELLEEGMDESDDSDSEEEYENADIDDELREAVAHALKVGDDEGSDDESEDLDDEQMISLGFDAKLAEVFRNRNMEKKKKQSIIKSVVDFRFRIVDLLEVFARSVSNSKFGVQDQLVRAMQASLFRSALIYENVQFVVQELSSPSCIVNEKTAILAQISESITDLPAADRSSLAKRILNILKKYVLKHNMNQDDEDAWQVDIRDQLAFLHGKGELIKGLVAPRIGKDLTLVASDMVLHTIRNAAVSLKEAVLEGILAPIFEGSVIPNYLMKNAKAHIPAFFLVNLSRRHILPFSSICRLLVVPLLKVLVERQLNGIPIQTFQCHQIWFLIGEMLKRWTLPLEPGFGESTSALFFCATINNLNEALFQSKLTKESPKPEHQIIHQILAIVSEFLRRLKKFGPRIDSSSNKEKLGAAIGAIEATPRYSSRKSIMGLCKQVRSLLGAADSPEKVLWSAADGSQSAEKETNETKKTQKAKKRSDGADNKSKKSKKRKVAEDNIGQ